MKVERDAGHDFLTSYFQQLRKVLEHIDLDAVNAAMLAIAKCKGTVFCLGNGGSAATASHLALDLWKGAGISALSLCDSGPHLTALANDCGFSSVFEHWCDRISDQDIAIAISVSGESRNVLKALEAANRQGALTVGMGSGRGCMGPLCTISIVVPDEHYGRCEDGHLAVCHAIAYGIMEMKGQAGHEPLPGIG